MKRINTGVEGLDSLIEGGFPEKSSILVSGKPGTGKTIFGLQYLVEGLKNNEKVIYVSLQEETEEQIITQAEQFGWQLEDYIDDGMFEVICIKPQSFKTEVNKYNFDDDVERIVVDSISSVLDVANKKPRAILHSIIKGMKEHDATIVYVSEIDDDGLSRDGVSEYICDGVIKLDMSVMGQEVNRSTRVIKMRLTEIDSREYDLEFASYGLRIIE